MVQAQVELQVLARRHGSRVVRDAGASGFGALAVPEGRTLAPFRRQLAADADVFQTALQGRTAAASAESELGEVLAERDEAVAAEAAALAAVATTQQALDLANTDMWELMGVPGIDPDALDAAQAEVDARRAELTAAQLVHQEAIARRAAATVAIDQATWDFQAALGENARMQWHLEAAKHPCWTQGQHAWMAPRPAPPRPARASTSGPLCSTADWPWTPPASLALPPSMSWSSLRRSMWSTGTCFPMTSTATAPTSLASSPLRATPTAPLPA